MVVFAWWKYSGWKSSIGRFLRTSSKFSKISEFFPPNFPYKWNKGPKILTKFMKMRLTYFFWTIGAEINRNEHVCELDKSKLESNRWNINNYEANIYLVTLFLEVPSAFAWIRSASSSSRSLAAAYMLVDNVQIVVAKDTTTKN